MIGGEDRATTITTTALTEFTWKLVRKDCPRAYAEALTTSTPPQKGLRMGLHQSPEMVPKWERSGFRPIMYPQTHFLPTSTFLFCPFWQPDCLKRGVGEGQPRGGQGRARTGRGPGEERARTGECKGVRWRGRKTLVFRGYGSLNRQSESIAHFRTLFQDIDKPL